MNKVFGLGDYVKGSNVCYSLEGYIADMRQSTGSLKGLLYGVKDKNSGSLHYFRAEEIEKVILPSQYKCTLEDEAKEWEYLNGDKRIPRLNNIYERPYTIERWHTDAGNEFVTLNYTAYKRKFSFTTSMNDILNDFKTKPICKYAHIEARLNKQKGVEG